MRLPNHLQIRLAAAAPADPSTIRKLVAGEHVSPAASARIITAATRLGIDLGPHVAATTTAVVPCPHCGTSVVVDRAASSVSVDSTPRPSRTAGTR